MVKVDSVSELLTNEQAAALLGIRPNTLEIWRTKGRGPEFVKLGNQKQAPIRYMRAKILAWLEAQSFKSTSAYHDIRILPLNAGKGVQPDTAMGVK